VNAPLFNSGKVHQVTNGATRCGVGKRRTRVQWQMELGEVTCLRVREADSDGWPQRGNRRIQPQMDTD